MTNEALLKIAAAALNLDEMTLTPYLEDGKIRAFGEAVDEYLKIEKEIYETKAQLLNLIKTEINKRIS